MPYQWLQPATVGKLVWDVRLRERVHEALKHPEIVYAVAWVPNKDILISGSGDGKLRWWDLYPAQQEETTILKKIKRVHTP